ncbi:MAG: MBL fold metallo-hydrolase [candidate division Zixibacteria bacterium]|nr:MBL fold metallo-hydrolase [candidate division Zixibacteria bacterium]
MERGQTDMILKILTVGELQTNCYILGDEKTKQCVIIDPGGDFEIIEDHLEKLKLKVKYIILTHGHVDHIGALAQLKKATGAEILIHSKDSAMLYDPNQNLSIFSGDKIIATKADKLLEDREIIECGEIKLEVLHTPGHTPGSISLLTDKMIFTGDALFCGSIGRTDFPGSSYQKLISSIKDKILTKEDDLIIYPGHGPSSTIGEERKNNPFLTGDFL